MLALFTCKEIEAREKFQFTLGKDIHILSDKGLKKSKEQIFEAVGNVIITQNENAIYGEKATLSSKTGNAHVEGNVRYITPDMTLYGSQLNFNFRNQNFNVHNARILSDNYVVLGKKITKISNNIITGIDAEYSTCKDCPESWSIFGKKVHITLGEYIRIYSAFIKVKGVVVMYLPYIILPIKKNRETGFLFPSFGVNLTQGASFKVPWFWAINDSVDMTYTPAILGKRGLVNELQFRQSIAGNSWYEVNFLQNFDAVYEPSKKDFTKSGHHQFRYLGNYEHHFGTYSDFNHHLFYSREGDLDVQRDYDFYTDSYLLGTESEGSAFIDFRKDYFSLGVSGNFNRNLLYPYPKEFDNRYVQVLPDAYFSTVPLNIIHTNIFGLSRIDLGVNARATIFKQNHLEEREYIRNATRYNIDPYLEWHWGDLGPVHIKSTAFLDYQGYYFPYEKDKTYRKVGAIYETEASFTLEKLFGVAYQDYIPIEEMEIIEQKDNFKNKEISGNTDKKRGESEVEELYGLQLLGRVPKFRSEFSKRKIKISKSSYRHQQVYKLKHYYLANQEEKGNKRFSQQIRAENGNGQFDFRDALKEKVHKLNTVSSRTNLPVQNTIELQWNNTFIKKKVRPNYNIKDENGLRENFVYEKISYFDIGQGYDFSVRGDDIVDHLTRLKVVGGFKLKSWNFTFSEYYFYESQKHIFSINQKYDYGRGSASIGIEYDSFSTPANKSYIFNTTFALNDLLSLGFRYDYDIDQKRSNESEYYMLYSPANNCWRLQLSMSKTITNDKKFGFNFMINFNENSFQSFSDL